MSVDEQPAESAPAAALEQLAAEATDAEPKPASQAGLITVTLTGRRGTAPITVLPILDWGYDAGACLDRRDFLGWSRAALDDDNLAKFAACYPSLGEAMKFYAEYEDAVQAAANPSTGESAAS